MEEQGWTICRSPGGQDWPKTTVERVGETEVQPWLKAPARIQLLRIDAARRSGRRAGSAAKKPITKSLPSSMSDHSGWPRLNQRGAPKEAVSKRQTDTDID